jgi:hypothetical protein
MAVQRRTATPSLCSIPVAEKSKRRGKERKFIISCQSLSEATERQKDKCDLPISDTFLAFLASLREAKDRFYNSSIGQAKREEDVWSRREGLKADQYSNTPFGSLASFFPQPARASRLPDPSKIQ